MDSDSDSENDNVGVEVDNNSNQRGISTMKAQHQHYDSNNTTQKNTDKSLPKTGEQSEQTGFISSILLFLGGLLFLNRRRSKKEDK